MKERWILKKHLLFQKKTFKKKELNLNLGKENTLS
jgi:hypothetical protein